jgi:hypothetical protein
VEVVVAVAVEEEEEEEEDAKACVMPCCLGLPHKHRPKSRIIHAAAPMCRTRPICKTVLWFSCDKMSIVKGVLSALCACFYCRNAVQNCAVVKLLALFSLHACRRRRRRPCTTLLLPLPLLLLLLLPPAVLLPQLIRPLLHIQIAFLGIILCLISP